MSSPHQQPPIPQAPQDVQATFCATLVDEWVRGGLRAAVVCPGSRSTPLALAFADHPDLEVQVHHDERSGGFLALGMALASGQPVAVLVTSGTATTELHPAVVEAHHAGVPLLVCTADRPPELRDVGAPQTIDQNRLYGTAVRWYADPGVPDDATRGHWRAWAARALVETKGAAPGPVHLNLPFREPLVGTAGPLPAARGDGPWVRGSGVGNVLGDLASVAGALVGRRGLILAGHGSGPAETVVALADALGWPVVATPQASAWSPSASLVAHMDGILRSEEARRALRPDVVVRLGTPPASRVVNEWLAGSGAHEIVVGPTEWSDPSGTAADVLRIDPATATSGLLAAVDEVSATGAVASPEGWLARWRRAGDAAAEAVTRILPTLPAPNEPAVASDVVGALPEGSRLVVSSSMPIRDVERYASPRDGLRILANRGANGIDGVVSTAVGVAAGSRSPTALLIGDLAFLHDSNGLLGIRERGVNLVCVVVDNDGGGIFSFLPQARTLEGSRYEQLFGTPHRLDLVNLALSYGVDARQVDTDVADAVKASSTDGGVHVLVVRTHRARNVDIHHTLDTAIANAVDAALRTP